MLCALADGGRWTWRHPKVQETALHTAAAQGHAEAIRILLEAGAYVHQEDAVTPTPFVANQLLLCEPQAQKKAIRDGIVIDSRLWSH